MQQRWCHRRAEYHDPALSRHPGPLFVRRVDPGIGAFWAIVIVLLTLAGIAAAVLLFGEVSSDAARWSIQGPALLTFVLVFAFGPPALAMAYLGPIRTRLRRRVIAARCRLCVTCGHDLTGRPLSTQTCPECGRILSTRDAVIYWSRFLTG